MARFDKALVQCNDVPFGLVVWHKILTMPEMTVARNIAGWCILYVVSPKEGVFQLEGLVLNHHTTMTPG